MVTADDSGREPEAPGAEPERRGGGSDRRSAARREERARRRAEKRREERRARKVEAAPGTPEDPEADDIEDAEEADAPGPEATAIVLRGETRPEPKPEPEPPSMVPGPRQAESVAPMSRPLPSAPARVSGRRSPWFLILSFLLLVALPAGYAVHYLWWEAVDRYHSVVGFSVRSEEPVSATPELPIALPKGFTGALDSDILYEFIRSQQLVEKLDAELDLRAIWNKRPEDWVFSFGEDRPIEDLVDYWRYMVDVNYDTSTALIAVTAHAFTPEDAQRITRAILRESTALINSLSQAARDDAIRHAERDLAEAEARLKEIRLALRAFRDRTQTADPTKDVEVQMGVIMALQQQLAEALIGRAEIADVARPGDPRIAELDRRIRAIEAQIETEKSRLGSGGDESANALADRIGTFEELSTDLQFAEEAYKQARAAYDLARIEARRQSRYLAAHIEPTLSEAPQYPQRWLLAALVCGALVTVWGMAMLIWYNVGDRR